MRRSGVRLGVAAGVLGALLGGCQWIAGVEGDATLYPADAGTSTGSSGEDGGTCAPGAMQECYSGAMGTKGVGICRAGMRACREDGAGYEAACSGEVTPKAESCGGKEDEDCDGHDCVQWAELFGDSGEQVATSIAIDAAGNSLVVGNFSGVIPFGTNVIKSMGSTDGFLLKFDPAGKPLWGIGVGDANDAQSIDAVATDSDGNVLITGFSFSSFSLGGAMLPKGPFVAKLDKDGKHAWSKGFVLTACANGSTGNARLAITPQNDVIVAGAFCGTISFGDGTIASQGVNTSNGFIAKLSGKDGSGKTIDGGWLTTFGDGSNSQHISDVAAAITGEIVAVGEFNGSLKLGSPIDSFGGSDIFVAKLGPSGVPTWTVRFGGPGDDTAGRIAVDKFGGPVVLGGFMQSISLNGQAINAIGGASNGLVVKIATDKSIDWYKQIPTGAAFSPAVDGNDNIFLTGIFKGSLDFGAGPLTSTGTDFNLFLTKLTKGGSAVWSKHFEGSPQPLGVLGAVAVNKANEPIMAGGTDVPIDFGTGLMTPFSNADGFLAKFSP